MELSLVNSSITVRPIVAIPACSSDYYLPIGTFTAALPLVWRPYETTAVDFGFHTDGSRS